MYWHLLIFSMAVLHFLNAANSRMGSYEYENDKYAAQNFYEDKFKDITNKIDMLSTSNDDLHIKFDRNNRRHEQDLMSLKNSLESIKELLLGGKEYRGPNERERKEKEIDLLLTNNIGEELNKLMKKIFDVQHNDLQDVKDALRNETTELRNQFEKQNRLLQELEEKFRRLDQQLKSDTKDDPDRRIENIDDELNKIMDTLVNSQHNDLQDVADTLKNATIEMQRELQKQNQLLKELQEKFNRIEGQRKLPKEREHPRTEKPYYHTGNYNENDNSARKKPRSEQCNCQQDFQKLKREVQTEFQKQSRQFGELLDKFNQMDQQFKVKLERESYAVKNEMDLEFQKQSRLLLELQEKLNKVGQQVKSKLEIESNTIRNGLQEELQNHNRLLLDMQDKFNRTEKDINAKLDMDAKRDENLIVKFDQTRSELSNNMKEIKESLKDEFQKNRQQYDSLFAELQEKLKQMTQQIKDELNGAVLYIVETLADRITEMRDNILTNQNNNMADIKDVLLSELRDNFQKESQQLNELKTNFDQELARDVDQERRSNDKFNEMQKIILKEQQNELRDLKDTLQHEFKNEIEKQNPRLADLQTVLNKVDQDTSRISMLGETFGKMKEELLDEERKSMKELIDQLNQMKKELSTERQNDIQDVKEMQTKELDLLTKFQNNYDQQNENMKSVPKMESQIKDHITEKINVMLNDLQSDQKNIELKMNTLKEDILKNQVDVQKDLRDVLQNEFKAENLLLIELKSILSNKDPEETKKLGQLSEEVNKSKEELLANQRKNLDDLKETLTNESSNIRGETQKQSDLLAKLQKNYDQLSEDVISQQKTNVTSELNVLMKEMQTDVQDIKLILKNQTAFKQENPAIQAKSMLFEEKATTGNIYEELSIIKEELLANQHTVLEECQKQYDLLAKLQSNYDPNMQNPEKDSSSNEIMKVLQAQHQEIKQLLEIHTNGLGSDFHNETKEANDLMKELETMLDEEEPDTYSVESLFEEFSKTKGELLAEQRKNLDDLKDMLKNESADIRGECQKQYDILEKLQNNYNLPHEDWQNSPKTQNHDRDNSTNELHVLMKELQAQHQEIKQLLQNKMSDLGSEFKNETKEANDLMKELDIMLDDDEPETYNIENLSEEFSKTKDELLVNLDDIKHLLQNESADVRGECQKQSDILAQLQHNYDQLNEDLKNSLKIQNQDKDNSTNELNVIMKELQAQHQEIKQLLQTKTSDLGSEFQNATKETNDLIKELEIMLDEDESESYSIENLFEEFSKTKDELLVNLNDIKDMLKNESTDVRGEYQKQSVILEKLQNNYDQLKEGLKNSADVRGDCQSQTDILTKLQKNYEELSENMLTTPKMQNPEKDNSTYELNALMKELQAQQQEIKQLLESQGNEQKETKEENEMIKQLDSMLDDDEPESYSIENLFEKLTETKDELLAGQRKNLGDIKDMLKNEKNSDQINEDIKNILKIQNEIKDKCITQLHKES